MILEVFSAFFTYVFGIIFAYLVYNYWKNYTFWSDSGLPYIPFPRDSVFYPVHKVVTFKRFYDEMAPHPVVGFHKMSRPHLMIRDPALIRKILIKDFSYFVDHGVKFYEDLDPLNAHIFNVEGERWRLIRQKLSPIFTSGKLKTMFPMMTKCKEALENYLDDLTKNQDQLDLLDVMAKFATDVIGTCGFGLQCNAIQHEDTEYRQMMKTVMRDSSYFALRSFLRSTNIPVIHWLGLKRIPEAVDQFFFGLVKETAKLRGKNAEKRKDVIQHILNLQHEERENLKNQNGNAEPVMTDTTVAANAFVLFLAGYETTSGTLAYILYEFALHPEIMEKCRKEVKSVLEKHGRSMSYDCLKDMTYMECCIEETLRKYAILGWLDRTCNKDYELPDQSYTVKKGTRLIIPVHALHYDPAYWPDPEKFNPDRFNEENKPTIVPGTYIPFGDGPRICIGMRFALMEIKTALAFLITKYDFEPTEKTEIPLQFKRKLMLTMPQTGIWLKLKKREQV